eukprot:352129-Chlamydomonas_euryale.AAC.14
MIVIKCNARAWRGRSPAIAHMDSPCGAGQCDGYTWWSPCVRPCDGPASAAVPVSAPAHHALEELRHLRSWRGPRRPVYGKSARAQRGRHPPSRWASGIGTAW